LGGQGRRLLVQIKKIIKYQVDINLIARRSVSAVFIIDAYRRPKNIDLMVVPKNQNPAPETFPGYAARS
jgi:hypothetical protein